MQKTNSNLKVDRFRSNFKYAFVRRVLSPVAGASLQVYQNSGKSLVDNDVWVWIFDLINRLSINRQASRLFLSHSYKCQSTLDGSEKSEGRFRATAMLAAENPAYTCIDSGVFMVKPTNRPRLSRPHVM